MKKPDSFILNNFDEEKLKHIIFYIQQEYSRGAIIYGSAGFCNKMASKIFVGYSVDILIDDDNYYKNLDEKDVFDTGLIGQYICNTPIICVPELNEINAVIVPDWGNFWNNYLEEKNNKGE